ncbi:MAG: HPr(Ser) kinase/phosphatase [Candidatus Aminicenantaceae bacterium]
MNSEETQFIKIEEFYHKTKEILKLKPAIKGIENSGKKGKFSSRKSFYPVQIWSKKEIQYLKKNTPDKKRAFLNKIFEDNQFCIILAESLPFPPELKNKAKKRKVALFHSELSRKRCQKEIEKFFLSLEREEITISSELLQISGLGVLIIGDSGIGKSECALELISRGHRFVSDDVVHIKKTAGGKLIGMAPSLSRNFMEIRGLGVINIREIFGPKSMLRQTKIDLVIKLIKWQQGKGYDRIGLKFPDDYEILGKKIPQLEIPVAPGRNIATLIEIASKVHMLRKKGYSASEEIISSLNRALSHS